MIPENCTRCGYCCQLIVRLIDDDIKRIRREGFKENDFLAKDPRGNPCLKTVNSYCVFLKITNGTASCKIYNARPARCNEFPGKKICDLRKHYSFVVDG